MQTAEFSVNGLNLTFSDDQLALIAAHAGGEVVADAPDGVSLWELTVANEAGWRVKLDCANAQKADAAYNADTGVLALSWQNIEGSIEGLTGTAGPFDVEVTVSSVAGHPGLAAWRIDVQNNTSEWTLWQVTFPNIGGVVASNDPANDRLVWPHGWGREALGWDAMPELRHLVRGWDFSMQMFGLQRGGKVVYLAVNDPEQNTKKMEFSPGPKKSPRRGRMGVTTFPEGMTLPGNGFRQSYDTLFGVIDGDWYDAGAFYGEWARRQSYAAEPRGGTKQNRPFTDVIAWQLLQFPHKPMDQWAAEMQQVSELLGVKLGIHFYNWHQIPFDISYPDYFPERPGFKDFVAKMKGLGILTMPYINARLWDLNAPSWNPANAYAASAKDTGCRVNPPTIFNYREDYGSGQKLSPMCPTTRLWQDTVKNLCARITGELGCDGVYLDQVAAESAKLCFDPDHGHPLGGGGFWLKGYREMLDGIRMELPAEKFLTTECNWEAEIADFDGLLMWHSHGDDLIPLFAAAYGGLAQTFGCDFKEWHMTPNGGREFALRMARLLAWGAQLGWGDLTLLLRDQFKPLAEYFGKLCRARRDNLPVFSEGRMLRVPQIESKTQVVASLWQKKDDTAVLFLINTEPEATEAAVTVTAKECRGMKVQSAMGVVKKGADPLGFEIALQPFDVVVLELE